MFQDPLFSPFDHFLFFIFIFYFFVGEGGGSRSQLGILRAFSRKMVANESQNNFAIFFPEKGRILHFAVGRRAQGARRFLPKALFSAPKRTMSAYLPFILEETFPYLWL